MRYRNLPAHIRRELRDLSRLDLHRSLAPAAVSSISLSPRVVRRAFDIEAVQSGRQFHPLASFAPPRMLNGNPARIIAGRPFRFSPAPWSRKSRSLAAVGSASAAFSMPVGVRFAVPAKTVVCIRRKRRRAAIFAGGYSGRTSRRRRQTPFSEVRC